MQKEGKITFEDFLQLLEKGNKDVPGEGPDPKVLEFLRILEEYRIKCEEEVRRVTGEEYLRRRAKGRTNLVCIYPY